MKQKLSILAALFVIGSAHASSNIPLPVPGDGTVQPKFGKLAVPMNLLPLNLYYNVTCHVDNAVNSNVAMSFSADSSSAGATKISLNGVTLATRQGNLKPGSNEVRFETIVTYSSNNSLYFMDLDDTYSVRVSDCVASPMVGSK